MADEPLGWLITVEVPDGGPPKIYNVAIANERDAINAVRDTLSDPTTAVVKVKSQLTERLCRALKISPGQVMAGAQPRKNVKRSNRR